MRNPLALDDQAVVAFAVDHWYPSIVATWAQLGAAADSSTIVGCPEMVEDPTAGTAAFTAAGPGCIGLDAYHHSAAVTQLWLESTNEWALSGAYRFHGDRFASPADERDQDVGFRGHYAETYTESAWSLDAHFRFSWQGDGLYGGTPAHGAWAYDGVVAGGEVALQAHLYEQMSSVELGVSGDLCVDAAVDPVATCGDEGVGHLTLTGANVVDLTWDGVESCDGCATLTIDGEPVEGCWRQ